MLFYYSKSMSLTKEECSCKCADNDKCVAWTFAKGYYYIIPFFLHWYLLHYNCTLFSFNIWIYIVKEIIILGPNKDEPNNCYLKHKADNRETKANHISGLKACTCKGYRKCQIDGKFFGINHSVHEKVKSASAKECSCECDKSESCGSWVFNEPALDCWLRGKDQSTGMATDERFTSGTKSCLCTNSECIIEKKAFSSNIIGSLSSFDFTKEECSCICDENPQCQAWTFTKDTQSSQNRCSLHSSPGQAEECENSVSGTKSCKGHKYVRCTNMSGDKRCIWENQSFSSNKIKSTNDMTKEECSCSCEDESECQAWTLNGNTCNLFKSVSTPTSSTNSISGLKTCESCEPDAFGNVDTERLTNQSCNQDDVAIIGEKISATSWISMKNNSLKECSCECQRNPNCVVWTTYFKGM